MEFVKLLGQGLVLGGCGFVVIMFAKYKLKQILPIFGRRHYQDEEEDEYYWDVAEDGSRTKVFLNKKSVGDYARDFRYQEYDPNWSEDGTFTLWFMKRFYPGMVEYIDHLHKAFDDLVKQFLSVGGLEISDMKATNRDLQKRNAELEADNVRLERANMLWECSYDEIYELLQQKVKEGVLQKNTITVKETEALVAHIEAKTAGKTTEIKETPQEAAQFTNKIDGTKSKKHKQLAIVVGVNAFGMTVADCQKRFNLVKEDTVQTYYRNGKNDLKSGEFDIEVGTSFEEITDDEGPVVKTRVITKKESYDSWKERADVSELLSLFNNDTERRIIYEWVRDCFQLSTLEQKVHPARKIA